MLSELDKGILAKPNKLATGAYLEQWLKGSVASTVAPSTYGSYAYITKKYLIPELGGIKLWNLNLNTFKDFMLINCTRFKSAFGSADAHYFT